MTTSVAAEIYMYRHLYWLLDVVAAAYGLSRRRLQAKRRHRRDTEARWVAGYILRRHAPEMSYPDIARLFGQHHTSIMHGERRVREMLEHDLYLQALVLEIEEQIAERIAA